MGIPETDTSIAAKVSRGSFPSMVPVRRHARHWTAYLAGGGPVVLIFALLVWNSLAEQKDPQNRLAQTYHASDEPSRSAPLVSAFVDDQSCQTSKEATYQIPCVAWQSMAATQEQASIGAITLVLGVIGSVFVAFTVYYARLTYREAKRSADAAIRALTDLERPHVFISIKRGFTLRVTDGAANACISLKLCNYGRFPADIRRVFVNAGEFIKIPSHGIDHENFHGVLAADKSTKRLDIHIEHDILEIATAQEGRPIGLPPYVKGNFIVRIDVRYFGVSPQMHVTRHLCQWNRASEDWDTLEDYRT